MDSGGRNAGGGVHVSERESLAMILIRMYIILLCLYTIHHMPSDTIRFHSPSDCTEQSLIQTTFGDNPYNTTLLTPRGVTRPSWLL